MVGFRLGTRTYQIPRELIPKGTYLATLVEAKFRVNKDDEGNIILPFNEDYETTFDAVFDYLVHGVVPDFDFLDNFDFLGMNFLEDYNFIVQVEDIFRDVFYTEFGTEMRKNDDHHLLRLTEEMWTEMNIPVTVDSEKLFHEYPLRKEEWNMIQTNLRTLDHLFGEEKNTIIAGGKIFSILFGTYARDIDVFLYGVSSNTGEKIIEAIFESELRTISGRNHRRGYKSLIPVIEKVIETQLEALITLGKHGTTQSSKDITETLKEQRMQLHEISRSMLEDKYHPSTSNLLIPRDTSIEEFYLQKTSEVALKRTKNAISLVEYIHFGMREIQVILRLYQTMSEVLHGFDVDSACVGYDGTDIWITQRCYYALTHGFNTVNFNRLSPSYEYRLAKYGARGMAVHVPNFKRAQAKNIRVEEFYLNNSEFVAVTAEYGEAFYTSAFEYNSREFRKLRGLDRLLVLEFVRHKNRMSQRNRIAFENLAASESDYEKVYKQRTPMSNYTCETLNILGIKLPPEDDFCKHHGIIGYPLKSDRLDGISIRVDVDHLNVIENNLLLDVPVEVYKSLRNRLNGEMIPRTITFKTISPGEQATGTFQKIVLADTRAWYGTYYD